VAPSRIDSPPRRAYAACVRIAIVSSLLPSECTGGAELYVAEAAASLSIEHDVVLLSGSPGEPSAAHEAIRLPRLPILREDAPKLKKLVWHARDQWLPAVHSALMREFGRARPDLVWTHEPQGLSAAVFTSVARSRLPHVHTAHDLNLLCARTTMTKRGRFCGARCLTCRVQRAVRVTTVTRRIDYLLAVSDYIRNRHLEAGIVPPERAVSLRVGAQPGRPRRRAPSPDAVHFGFIGALATHKGVLTLLRAFRSAPPHWRLSIAGTGERQREVAEAARADERIGMLGYVTGEAKEAFFERIDALVIPSEWEEPGPFAAVEAAIRGIPAVVSDRGGLPEMPEATVFRSGDAYDLLRAMRALVDAPGRLSSASSALLEQRGDFAWSSHMQKVETLLLAAVQAGPA
jgi:glycosyltransferase involved in cell wall biosynthesis